MFFLVGIYCAQHHFQQYFSNIVEVNFIGGWNWSTGENHRPVASHWQTLSQNIWSRTPRLSGIRTFVVIGTDCIGSWRNFALVFVHTYFHENMHVKKFVNILNTLRKSTNTVNDPPNKTYELWKSRWLINNLTRWNNSMIQEENCQSYTSICITV
jgi:hypothetical protein